MLRTLRLSLAASAALTAVILTTWAVLHTNASPTIEWAGAAPSVPVDESPVLHMARH